MKRFIKHFAKKSLAIILAMLTVLSAWVWVVPAPEAHAAAETLNYTLQQLYDTYLTEASGATFIKGKFPNDSQTPGDNLYVNVLYSPDYSGSTYSGSAQSTGNKLGVGSSSRNYNSIDIFWHHAETVMLYDGVTVPSTGIMLTTDPNKGGTWDGKSTVERSWVTTSDFAFPSYWKGICGANLDFAWAMTQGDQLNYLSTNSDNKKVITRKNKDKVPVYGNLLQYKGSMANDTYLLEVKPSFSLYVHDDKVTKTISATSSKYVRVVNYKTLKETIAKAKSFIETNIIKNPNYADQYTAASIAKLQELANALVAAKPDTTYFDGNKKCEYNAYAVDAKAAVDNWNNWGGLVKKSYVMFDNMFDFTAFTIGGNLTVNERTETGFTVTSTAGDGNTGFSYSIPVEPGKTYVFSADADFTPVSGGYDMYIHTLDVNQAGETTATPDTSNGAHREGNVYISLTGQTTNKKPYIRFTAGSNTRYIKIRFDANDPGNKLTVNNIRVYEDGKLATNLTSYIGSEKFDYNVAYGTLPTPTKTCYTFAGWVDANGNKVDASSICKVQPGQTQVLYSTWTLKGHSTTDVTYIDAVERTCTQDGYTQGEICNLCGEISVPQVLLEKLGHAYVAEPETPPTCQQNGYITHRCSRCNDSYQMPGTPSTGNEHKCDVQYIKASSCTEGDKYTYTCTVPGCGYSYTEEKAPIGHIPVWQETVPPTCTERGYDVLKCMNCDYTVIDEDSYVEAKGHSWVAGAVTAPTCTEKGYTTYTCSVCTDTKQKDFVDATGHTYTAVVTPPTCTEQGYTTYTCHCKNTYTDNYVDATGHTYESVVVKDPSCRETGLERFTCHCGYYYEKELPVSEDHNYVPEIKKPATCVEAGSQYLKCGCGRYKTVDGTENGKKVEEAIPKLGHDFSSRKYIAADDKTHHIKCSRCDTYGFYDENDNPQVGSTEHGFDSVVTAPTCTEKGYTTYTCELCHYEYKDNYVDANDHSWNKGVVTDEPCCTKQGKMLYTCTVDGCKATKTETIEALGLDIVVKTKAYDRSKYCGELGYQAFWTCTKCSKIYKNEELTERVTSTDFTEVNGVKVPTELLDEVTQHEFSGGYFCIESGKNGKHAQKCVRYEFCGQYDEANAAGHDFDKNNDGVIDESNVPENNKDADIKLPTHLEIGERRYTCEICKDQYADPIAVLPDHTLVVDEDLSKAPTCKTAGFEIWACDCGYREERILSSLGHGNIVSEKEIVKATCTADGEKIVEYSCGCLEYETIPAIGYHVFGKTVPAVPATCKDGGAKGNEAYKQCNVCKLYFADSAVVTATNGSEGVNAFELPALKHTFIAGGNDVNVPECEGECEHEKHDTIKYVATCTTPTVYKVHCDRCGVPSADATYTYGEALGHNFNGGAIKSNENGTHSFKCTNVDGNTNKACDVYGPEVTCVTTICTPIENDDVNHKLSCACGYSVTEKHTLPDEWEPVEGTNNLVKACKKCSYKLVIEKTQCVYDEGVVTVPATCTTDGEMTYTCTVHENCETKTKTEKIPATGHENYIEGGDFLKEDATCQTDAVYYKVCSVCGEVGTDTWTKADSKLDHDWSKWYWADDTHSRKCTTCDPKVAAVATESATCTGGTANCLDKAVCEVCNNAYGTTDTSNHKTVVTVPEKPATCQTEGKKAYEKCSDCGTAIDAIEKIPVVDHKFSAWTQIQVDGQYKHTRSCETCDLDVAAAVTETGDCTGGTANCQDKAVCSVCKSAYGDIDPAIHKSTETYVDESTVVAATCQTTGESGDVKYACCDAVKEASHATDKLDHTFVKETETPATCIATGSITYKCSTCKAAVGEIATYSEPLEIDPTKHASDEIKTVGAKDATCIEDGYTGDKYYACCYDAEKTEEQNRRALKERGTTIKANGEHTYTAAVAEYLIERIETETDSEGNVTGKKIVLVETTPDYAAIVEKRHNDGKWYHVQLCTECSDIKLSACGAHKHTYNCVETDICSACSGLCSLKDAKKHKSIVEVEGTDATCTATGMKSYFKCEGCNVEFYDEAGKKKLQKDDDGNYKHDDLVIPVAAHDFDTTVEYAGEGENADKKYYRCKNYRTEANPDGCTGVQEIIPEGGDDVDEPTVDDHEHVWSEDYKITDEPTCTEHGYKAHYCTVEGCNEIQKGSHIQVTALGHAWNDGEVTTAATCDDDGAKTYTCTREGCAVTKTEAIEKLGHKWDEGEVTKQATCKEAGEKTYTCQNDASHTYTEVIPKGQHVVGDEIIRSEPGTCTKPGINWTKCSVCGTEFSSEGVVDKNNHSKIVIVPGKEATCVSDGYTDAIVCSDCKTVIEKSTPIDHADVPHEDRNGDGYCDDCSFDMFTGDCDCLCHKQNGIMKIFYKIAVFFWKIFGTNKSCRCGNVHY